jgi:hypothetical protein
MIARLIRALLIVVALLSPWVAHGQSKNPKLSKAQRDALWAAVTAAKTAPPLAGEHAWQMHLLRASDGSHYVAFSMEAPADLTPEERLVLYVRLEPRPNAPPSATPPPRSTVEAWLRGERGDPLPMRATRVITVPSGELPMGGTAATMTRDGSGQNSAVIALMDRQMRKQREEAEAREKARQEELEGKTKAPMDVMPFEDFDLQAHVLARAGRAAVFQRALTAGPGDYDVVLAWTVVDQKDKPVRTGALRHAVSLPAVQTTGLALGSVILADAIRARTDLYTAEQQTAHPYAIGGTEIDPAPDQAFTNEERLSVAFQIFNAASSLTGKPDVGVALRLYRKTPTGEELAASLAPLEYTEGTLPPDFSLLQGHPLLAAFAAPLRTLPRGEYRLAVGATDRVARVSTTAEARFRIVPTPAALLAEAPPVTARVNRARFTDPGPLDRALDALEPAVVGAPSLAMLLTLARERRFADVLAAPTPPPPHQGTGLLFQGLAGLVLGDTPRTLTVLLRRALEGGAPPGAAQYLLGASLALEARDEDALEAWESARRAGWPAVLLALPMAEAHIRQARLDRAGETARAALVQGVTDVELLRVAAAADIANRQFGRALETLSPQLIATPADTDTRWLALHAIFASFVAGAEPAAGPEGRQRFVEMVDHYLEAGGRHRALAEEWRALVTASASGPVP